jgi:predicted DNA-binding transcriptional regulator YafY
LLLERGSVTARELAERFEVSPRTIYRDVENLSSAGIPVYMEKGRNGGIRLLPDFVLDKTVLTPAEKEEILSALQGLAAADLGATAASAAGGIGASTAVTASGGIGTAGRIGAAGSTLHKLAALFGTTGGSWIEVDFSGWSWGREAKESFELLKTAVLSHHVITFAYYSSLSGKAAGGEKSIRFVEPLKLVFRGQSWYLYGWCRTRADGRFFKLSRLKDIVLLDEVFERETPARVTDLASLGPVPENIAVAFRADASIAFRIYDEYPHDSVRTEEDGSLLVRAEMPRGEWLVSYFLTYGQHIEILEPAFLRSEMMEAFKAAIGKYTRHNVT